MTTLLVFGGAGFIGINFVHYMRKKYPDYRIVVVDNFSLAGTEQNVQDIQEITVERADIRHFEDMLALYKRYKPEYVVNFAAESHNDRAILLPNSFFETNAVGCQYLLECSRQVGVKKHVHISTIEVYGEQAEGVPYFTEESPLNAKTPYSAAKAGGDMAVRSYMKTYDVPICMTHCANNYGPYQYPEKLIPLAITNLLTGQKVPMYGDGLQKRDWLHVDDHALAIDLVLHKGKAGEIYDISSRNERTNIDIISRILGQLCRDDSWIDHVADRPNHDRRYLIEPGKIERELGFKPQVDFDQGLKETVQWYLDHEGWWRHILELNSSLQIDWSKGHTQNN